MWNYHKNHQTEQGFTRMSVRCFLAKLSLKQESDVLSQNFPSNKHLLFSRKTLLKYKSTTEQKERQEIKRNGSPITTRRWVLFELSQPPWGSTYLRFVSGLALSTIFHVWTLFGDDAQKLCVVLGAIVVRWTDVHQLQRNTKQGSRFHSSPHKKNFHTHQTKAEAFKGQQRPWNIFIECPENSASLQTRRPCHFPIEEFSDNWATQSRVAGGGVVMTAQPWQLWISLERAPCRRCLVTGQLGEWCGSNVNGTEANVTE